jgi:membrane carboxypeptidase/penicillin-binding protein
MTLWLDRVYFGDSTYGIESAAWRFYDRPVEELDDAEIALLVGRTSMPSRGHEGWWHRAAIATLERAGRPVPEWVWLGALRPDECHEL